MSWLIELIVEFFVHSAVDEAAKRHRLVRWLVYGISAILLGFLLGWIAKHLV